MSFTVTPTSKAHRAIGREVLWRERCRSQASADRWFQALDRAMTALADSAGSHALCRESDDLPGGPYRECYFGVGRAKSHRLVYRVRGGTAEVVAVRSFAQRDLATGDV